MIFNSNILMSDIEFRTLRSDAISKYHHAVRNFEWTKAREYRDSINELLSQYWQLTLTHKLQ